MKTYFVSLNSLHDMTKTKFFNSRDSKLSKLNVHSVSELRFINWYLSSNL